MQKQTNGKMTDYLMEEEQIGGYMAYPRFLMDMDLGCFEKLVYVLLLNRFRLSLKPENRKRFSDVNGRIFIIYPISHLARDLGKCESTIKKSMRSLRKSGLIETVQQGMNEPNRIYVKIPIPPAITDEDGQTDFYPSGQTEYCLSGGVKNCLPKDQKAVLPKVRKLSANINDINTNDYRNGTEGKEPAPVINDKYSDESFIPSYYLPISNSEYSMLVKLYSDRAIEIYRFAQKMARDSRTVKDFNFVLEIAKKLNTK